MNSPSLVSMILSLACLSAFSVSADADQVEAERWMAKAVESSRRITTESAISHAADKLSHAHARLGQVDDAFNAAKRVTNPQLKLYALAATTQAAVNADQSTDLMVAEAGETLKGNEGSFNNSAMENILRIAETRQKTLPATTKQPELPPIEQLQKAFDHAQNRGEKLAAFQPLMMRSLQKKSFETLERAIEEAIKMIEKNPLPDQSSKFGTYGDAAAIAQIRVTNLRIATMLADEGKNDEAARHLALANSVIDRLPESSALVKWELQNLRIQVLLKLKRIDAAIQDFETIRTPLIASRAAADIAVSQIENGQVEAGLKTADRIGTGQGSGDDRGMVAIALFKYADRNIAVQYINQVGETDEAMNALISLSRHWIEIGDMDQLRSTFDSINSPTARTHYAISAATFLMVRDLRNVAP
ncbi:hypothetical protein [Novipirellula artificiosorum]|uniref:Tetratricopeptide repeat protein n=1 Tax=Novipirellula artificiosorum TaxID=2528016 RepID=A0A5C6DRV0_9BACT|nr:hypothetical protein [Novipirellula artificiosorum]TWU38587.1 hypothetical protein Poly41_30640 [Novipirellula artificiosorum]